MAKKGTVCSERGSKHHRKQMSFVTKDPRNRTKNCLIYLMEKIRMDAFVLVYRFFVAILSTHVSQMKNRSGSLLPHSQNHGV